jgi:Cu2+-exporting ATPase
VAAPPIDCFHCGEALAGREPLWVRLNDSDQAVCCPGCRAAAQLISQLGLEDFYRFRTAPAVKPGAPSDTWLAYDEPALLDSLSRRDPRGRAVILTIDGLTCAACSWLIQRSLTGLDGVVHAGVNTATGRAQVVWDEGRIKLSQLMQIISELGYQPHVVTADNADALAQAERRSLLKRLAVAGLGMMQVMMFAVALYVGNSQGMETDVRAYLRIVSMLVATPVMFYAGWPYFANGARALAGRSITMDVPVSLALILAYGASVFNTWRHAGEVYFDSVTMFIFFLTVARYVEMVARHQCTRVSDSLSRLLPVTAHRVSTIEDRGEIVTDVTVAALKAGDLVLVRAGEVVPADGRLESAGTQFDEAMLTGESLPVARPAGDHAIAGTINVGSPVRIRVTATGGTTVLSSIVALLHRAQSERPRITRDADRMASRFLSCVLVLACVIGAIWCVIEPSRAFSATLAMLVAACPCAFSLATLVAVASANAALARRGVLVTHPDAVESLTRVTRVVFDKTGTLTSAMMSVSRCRAKGPLSEQECLEIAAALEVASEHPIARAFASTPGRRLDVGDMQVVPGAGITGMVEGKRYQIGTRAFVAGFLAGRVPADDDATIVLTGEGVELATFELQDTPRPEGPGAVRELLEQGLSTEILSGDSFAAVSRLAGHCGISAYSARQSPADKLERVKALSQRGEFIAMVGDGINDAPVLGGAGLSVAMSRGSALALASADLVLIGDSLRALPGAFLLARRARRIMRQNLVWAAAYNLVAMPLAALGWVPPWAAAIGMSLSSILVVLNSVRLMRDGRSRGREPRRGRAPLSVPPIGTPPAVGTALS